MIPAIPPPGSTIFAGSVLNRDRRGGGRQFLKELPEFFLFIVDARYEK